MVEHRIAALQALRELQKALLEFPAENGRDAKLSQIICIHWRVQTVTAKMSERVLLAQARDQLCSKTRRRVHREGIWRSIRRRKWRLRPEIGGKDRDRRLHGCACAARLPGTPVQMAAARAHMSKSGRCSRPKQYNRRSAARNRFRLS